MASSTAKMNVSLDRNAKVISAAAKFSHAILNKNSDEIITFSAEALSEMGTFLIPVMVKKALQVVQANADNANLLRLFQELINLTKNGVPQPNSRAIWQGMDAYLRGFSDKNLASDLYCVLIDMVIQNSEDEGLVSEWKGIKTQIDGPPVSPVAAVELPQAPVAAQAYGYWNLYGGVQYVMQQASRLKDWAVYYEKASDDLLLDSSPNNSPRPQ